MAYNSRNITNLLSLINFSKNKNINQPLDVVIAHYKEDLSWVDKYLPKNCRIFIYSKSDMIPNCKRKYTHKFLKNVGREGHTFLYHIINNYDKKNLRKNTIFTCGSIELIHKKIILLFLLKNIGKYKFNGRLSDTNYFINKLDVNDDKRLLKYGYCSSSKYNKNKNCSLKVKKFKNINEFTKFFGLNIKTKSKDGVFMIKTNLIYNRPKSYYQKMIKYLDHADNTMNGHFLENSWYTIFLN
tara:strand:- start:1890 stop:2612 length:723 start_codon:yes stop_codon:yes gene_type:complete